MIQEKERLQKLLSQAGIASRREAEKMILSNRVRVNGEIAVLGQRASFTDDIEVDGIPIEQERKVYYVLNKPKHTLTTMKDPRNRDNVMNWIDVPYRVFPVGRLDYDTTGVLIFTNDGELANKLMHPSYGVKRVYRARLNEPLEKKELKILNGPVELEEGLISNQMVITADTKSYFVVLSQGTYHHVKRLFEFVNKKVINLKRVEYAGVTVEKLPEGKFRSLTIKEIKNLHEWVRIKRS
ncbi:pseudouridine synthase [Mycoplasma nasistruthionis]|uniref:Pseudouridine synthase n=1 Tax=Mycoplasma nasistruthionis TaxID=353852 RepID=A0A4Y6I6P4_9MOLU|nr:pseudouridine synthase [Mycoplasma nasistruthionis]QDF64869.1 rRNA pseudouridine synthase [Mycoplasma nasistruthionis]